MAVFRSIIVDSLADRPLPNDPTLPIDGTTYPLFLDEATGDLYITQGVQWTKVGQLPVGTSLTGVTTDGQGNMTVQGQITVAQNGQFSTFNGSLGVVSGQIDYENGQGPLGVTQEGTLDADGGLAQPAATVVRSMDRSGRTVGNPTFQVIAQDASGGGYPVPADEPVFQSTSEHTGTKKVTTYADGSLIADAGIGFWNTAPVTSRPLVALTTSTITDPAAVAAIRALKNILVGYGMATISED